MSHQFTPIPDDLLALATPGERRAYTTALKKHIALSTPLDFVLATKEDAKDYRASRFVSNAIAALPPEGKLLLMEPPRHGKSYIVSEGVPCWVHANDPNAAIIHATHTGDFTAKFGRRNRDLMLRAASMGLGPRLDPRSQSVSEYNVDPADGRGSYLATGVGGRIIGEPAHWFLMDDLIRNEEDAQSDKVRETTWDWYLNDALPRLEPGARVILMGTPRHEDDILARAIAGGEYIVIRLPAIAEDEDDLLGREIGEALMPERYPVEALTVIKTRSEKANSGRTWTTQYQIRPRPKEGMLFKEGFFRYYARLPKKGYRYAMLDLAHSTKTRADYTVLTVFFASKPPDPRLHVTHVFRERVESGRHMEWVDEKLDSIPALERPSWVGIENKTFGSTLLSAARIQGRLGKVPFRSVEADTDKVTRAQNAVSIASQGALVFKSEAPWLAELEGELLAFDKGTHDDQVDTIAYGANQFLSLPGHEAPPPPEEPATADDRARAHIARLKKRPQPQHARKAMLQG